VAETSGLGRASHALSSWQNLYLKVAKVLVFVPTVSISSHMLWELMIHARITSWM
jgi:hypothetical protein